MSLQTRLSDLITAIGTDIKALNTSVAQAAKRAVLVPDADATVDEASSVVWKRASDGAYVAYETVQEIPSAPNRAYSKSDVVDSEGTGYAQQALRARGLVSGNRRAASIILAGSPSSRYVRALAETDSGGVQSKLIIDSAGKSDFIQTGTRMDLTNQTADVTFTGLTGDTDMAYELIVMGLLNPNGTPARTINVRPNGFTGGISTKHRHWRNNDGTQGHDTQVTLDAGIVIGQSDFDGSVAGTILAKAIIMTKVQANGRRMFSNEWSYMPNTNFAAMHGHSGGVYYGPTPPTVDPITSLVINFNSQTFSGAITLKALL